MCSLTWLFWRRHLGMPDPTLRLLGAGGAELALRHPRLIHTLIKVGRSALYPRLDVLIRSAYPCCPQCCHDHESGTTYKYCPTRPIDPQLHIPGARILGLVVHNSSTVVLSSFSVPTFLSFCPLHCWHGVKTPLFISSRCSRSRTCPSRTLILNQRQDNTNGTLGQQPSNQLGQVFNVTDFPINVTSVAVKRAAPLIL